MDVENKERKDMKIKKEMKKEEIKVENEREMKIYRRRNEGKLDEKRK